jgi:undecaprenyl diphosphate synthase
MESASAALKFRESTLKAKPGLPRHIGIIMDGNGRWAESQGRPRLEGHREGSNSVRDVTRCARRTGIEALTLYAFSSQNWQRPSLEVAGLMELLREYLIKERREILDNQIRLNAIGELHKLPESVREPLDALREESGNNAGMVLTLALSYGGREELVQAMRAVARKVERGELTADALGAADLERELWTTDLPPVDLVIRTSGESRVSNFLLWQGAYAEYLFTETLWPDFRAHELLDCIEHFQNRERRFGLTSAQLRAIP